MYLGLRGFPGVQGGVETHCQYLCPLLTELGCDVEVVVRKPYMPVEVGKAWHGVRLLKVWVPKYKSLEAILHTFLGVLVAAWKRPDILHIQAIGPAIFAPFARFMGLRVIVTHHGSDYNRQKWGSFGKWALRLGERWGMRWSNGRIVISEEIKNFVKDNYRVDSALIPNGIALPKLPQHTMELSRFGLTPGRYVLLVSRLVPEKRHMDLIEAFQLAELQGWKLAIVGAADHPDAYTKSVMDTAAITDGVVCTGFQSGEALHELYGHAGIFVLPSSHEGLPIALLEALSYGLPVLASDIPANLEVGLRQDHYFPLGNVHALAERLNAFSTISLSTAERELRRQWVIERYNWKLIAERTFEVYQTVINYD